MKTQLILLIVLFTPFFVNGQDTTAQSKKETFKRSRISLGIGHAHIPSAEEIVNGRKRSIIPSWGASYAYYFTEQFSIGLKSDMEVANYVIYDDEGNALERENPISLALSFEYKIHKGFGVFAAPGIEFEENNDLFVIVAGTFYEFEVRNGWDFTPELIYEIKGGHTSAITFAIGAGYSF